MTRSQFVTVFALLLFALPANVRAGDHGHNHVTTHQYGVMQIGAWSPWQPVEAPRQTVVQVGQWSPWRPIETPQQPMVQIGPWSPWRPVGPSIVEPNEPTFVEPTIVEPIRESRRQIPVDFVNDLEYSVTLTIAGSQYRLRPGAQHHAHVLEGQSYSLVGPATQTADGRMLSGVTMRGTCESSQRTIRLSGAFGKPRHIHHHEDDEPLAVNYRDGGKFQVTFYNHHRGAITVSIVSNGRTLGTRELAAGGFITAQVPRGAEYHVGGPAVHRNGGIVSGTSYGYLDPSQPEVHLGR
ncbi:MAG: hypothetical protein KDB14_00850 [Planctomycetales bacterium]|nr:hypothetical protein [Planctomycetales bacterium]